jgi:hypothetical protein
MTTWTEFGVRFPLSCTVTEKVKVVAVVPAEGVTAGLERVS